MLDYGYVSLTNEPPDLDALINANTLAIDSETSGLNIARDIPYGFSVSCNPNNAFYAYMANRFFTDLISNEDTMKVGHNIKFDRAMYKRFGIEINNICDTMIAAHLLEEPRLSLKELLFKLVSGRDLDVKFFKEFGRPIPSANLQEMANHFGPHSSTDLLLWEILKKKLKSERLWDVFWNVEMPLVPVLCDMEMNGSMIDMVAIKELGDYFDAKCDFLGGLLADMSGQLNMNWNSSAQVSDYLYKVLKIPLPRDKHGKVIEMEEEDSEDEVLTVLFGHEVRKPKAKAKHPSVEKKVIEIHQGNYPIIRIYLSWKSYKHLKNTYVTGISKRLVDGRIHTHFNQTRTQTGRLSSSDPNLQNIPSRAEDGRKIRLCFIAPEGKKIVKADMDQVELRKAACLSNCTPLLDAFREGRDPHTETAIRAYGDASRRADGKTLNFKLVYGGGGPKEQAILFTAYPQIKQWSDSMLSQFTLLGYAKTHYGRIRHLGDIAHMSRKDAAHAHREGLSVMDQGSCSEYLKLSMRKVSDQIKNSEIKMLLQVHDELVFECPIQDLADFVPFLKDAMRYDGLQIPLTATLSVGNSWGSTKQIGDKK